MSNTLGKLLKLSSREHNVLKVMAGEDPEVWGTWITGTITVLQLKGYLDGNWDLTKIAHEYLEEHKNV